MQAGSGIAGSLGKGVVNIFERLQRESNQQSSAASLDRPEALHPDGLPQPAEGLPPKKRVGQTFSRRARPPWQRGNWVGFLTGRQGICQLKTAFSNPAARKQWAGGNAEDFEAGLV